MKRVVLYTNDEILSNQLKRELIENYEVIPCTLDLCDYIIIENRYQPTAVVIDSRILKDAYHYLDLVIKEDVIVAVLNRQIETGPYYNYLSLPNFILLDAKKTEMLNGLLSLAIRLNDIIVKKNHQIIEYKEKIEEDKMVKKAKIALMKKGMSEEDSYKYILDYSMKNRITKFMASKKILESLN